MAYVLTQTMNNIIYYLEETGSKFNTWNSSRAKARTFNTKGQAEYFAVKKNIHRYLVKELSK